MLRILSLASLSLLLLPAAATPPAVSPASTVLPLPDFGCSGCRGSGGARATATGPGGATVSVSVAFSETAKCKWVMTLDEPNGLCRPLRGCTPIVTREWSGLPQNTPLEFKVTLDGQTLTLDDPDLANSGTGSGVNEFTSAVMTCDSSKVRSYGIECTPCGLAAATEVTCSSCPE